MRCGDILTGEYFIHIYTRIIGISDANLNHSPSQRIFSWQVEAFNLLCFSRNQRNLPPPLSPRDTATSYVRAELHSHISHDSPPCSMEGRSAGVGSFPKNNSADHHSGGRPYCISFTLCVPQDRICLPATTKSANSKVPFSTVKPRPCNVWLNLQPNPAPPPIDITPLPIQSFPPVHLTPYTIISGSLTSISSHPVNQHRNRSLCGLSTVTALIPTL